MVKTMDSTHFSFNGIKSEDMGISLVKLESNLTEEMFMAEREINMETIAGNPIPYVYDISETPFKISLTLAKLGDNNLWTLEERSRIARWLGVKKFAEFYSGDNPSKIYFLTYSGGINLRTNGSLQGYLTVEFQSVSPYMYTPIIRKIWNLDSITAATVVEIDNEGDTLLYPDRMRIYKVGAGSLSIQNLMDGGREFKFTGLSDKEELLVQNKLRSITTSKPDTLRYDNFNNNYLRLVTGLNRLVVTGACAIELLYRCEKLA